MLRRWALVAPLALLWCVSRAQEAKEEVGVGWAGDAAWLEGGDGAVPRVLLTSGVDDENGSSAVVRPFSSVTTGAVRLHAVVEAVCSDTVTQQWQVCATGGFQAACSAVSVPTHSPQHAVEVPVTLPLQLPVGWTRIATCVYTPEGALVQDSCAQDVTMRVEHTHAEARQVAQMTTSPTLFQLHDLAAASWARGDVALVFDRMDTTAFLQHLAQVLPSSIPIHWFTIQAPDLDLPLGPQSARLPPRVTVHTSVDSQAIASVLQARTIRVLALGVHAAGLRSVQLPDGTTRPLDVDAAGQHGTSLEAVACRLVNGSVVFAPHFFNYPLWGVASRHTWQRVALEVGAQADIVATHHHEVAMRVQDVPSSCAGHRLAAPPASMSPLPATQTILSPAVEEALRALRATCGEAAATGAGGALRADLCAVLQRHVVEDESSTVESEDAALQTDDVVDLAPVISDHVAQLTAGKALMPATTAVAVVNAALRTDASSAFRVAFLQTAALLQSVVGDHARTHDAWARAARSLRAQRHQAAITLPPTVWQRPVPFLAAELVSHLKLRHDAQQLRRLRARVVLPLLAEGTGGTEEAATGLPGAEEAATGLPGAENEAATGLPGAADVLASDWMEEAAAALEAIADVVAERGGDMTWSVDTAMHRVAKQVAPSQAAWLRRLYGRLLHIAVAPDLGSGSAVAPLDASIVADLYGGQPVVLPSALTPSAWDSLDWFGADSTVWHRVVPCTSAAEHVSRAASTSVLVSSRHDGYSSAMLGRLGADLASHLSAGETTSRVCHAVSQDAAIKVVAVNASAVTVTMGSVRVHADNGVVRMAWDSTASSPSTTCQSHATVAPLESLRVPVGGVWLHRDGDLPHPSAVAVVVLSARTQGLARLHAVVLRFQPCA